MLGVGPKSHRLRTPTFHQQSVRTKDKGTSATIKYCSPLIYSGFGPFSNTIKGRGPDWQRDKKLKKKTSKRQRLASPAVKKDLSNFRIFYCFIFVTIFSRANSGWLCLQSFLDSQRKEREKGTQKEDNFPFYQTQKKGPKRCSTLDFPFSPLSISSPRFLGPPCDLRFSHL